MTTNSDISIVIPCLNDGDSLAKLLPRIRTQLPRAEILVIDDGSAPALDVVGARVIRHPYRLGNGAAIKTGARLAQGERLLFMDADGQHNPDDIPRLLSRMDEGYEMVIGARDPSTHASLARRLANRIYNNLASVMTGYRIDDLTSGFRVARARHFRKFIYLLPNSFSYPTTCTMAFLRSGLPIAYVPIRASTREGRSKIRMLRDGVRFFIIILKIGALFSPMRLFLPISIFLFTCGVAWYAFTYFTANRFTNMSALLLLSSLLTFLIGLISEQISSLHYRGVEEDRRRIAR